MKKSAKALFTLLIVLILFVGIVIGFAVLVKNRIISINQLVISPQETIGVDISSYQGNVDYEKLANSNIKFAYIKATEGSSHVDEQFYRNWEKIKQTAILPGAYHFFSFESSGAEQAKNYIRTVGSLDGALIPAIDLEYHGDSKDNPPSVEYVTTELGAFIQAIEDHYQVKPIIYMDKGIYDKYIQGNFDDYPRWIRNIYYPVNLEFQDSWAIWQYTDHGDLKAHDGTEKYIDLNVLSSNITLENLTVKHF